MEKYKGSKCVVNMFNKIHTTLVKHWVETVHESEQNKAFECLEKLNEKINELEKLAEVGRATLEAFEYMSLTDAPNAPDENICLIDKEDLLEWYKENKKENGGIDEYLFNRKKRRL